jgi:uncharacterized repeat protein (TIGR03803 family)
MKRLIFIACFKSIALLTFSQLNFYGTTRGFENPPNSKIIKYSAAINTLSAAYTFGRDAGTTNSLTKANNGIIYGVSPLGTFLDASANTPGIIYSFDPSTSGYNELYSFNASSNGRDPNGFLIQGNDGKLYGMTWQGGNNSSNGGVIFSFDPLSSVYSKLYDFTGGSNGNNSSGGVLLCSNGKFYGMTSYGGSNSKGVFFPLIHRLLFMPN